MVFGDYELVPTGRVCRTRMDNSIYNQRIWTALGGYPTIWLSLSVGCFAHSFFFSKMNLTTPIMTTSAMKSLARNAGKLALPAVAGFVIGMHNFGNYNEFKNLVFNGTSLKREINSVKTELYYT